MKGLWFTGPEVNPGNFGNGCPLTGWKILKGAADYRVSEGGSTSC